MMIAWGKTHRMESREAHWSEDSRTNAVLPPWGREKAESSFPLPGLLGPFSSTSQEEPGFLTAPTHLSTCLRCDSTLCES